MLANHEEFADILMELKDNLPKPEYDIYEIDGKPPELSDSLLSIVDEGLFDEEMAKIIQKQLIEEYEMGVVLNESLLTRFTYLCTEDFIEEDYEYNDNDSACPYCNFPVNLTDSSCRRCGYNLSYSPIISLNDIEDIDDIEDIFQIMLINSLNNKETQLSYISEDEEKEDDDIIYSLENGIIDNNGDYLWDSALFRLMDYLYHVGTLENACLQVAYIENQMKMNSKKK